MVAIDLKQNKQIGVLIGLMSALGGITAFIIWLEHRKHDKIQEEILKLDREIKMLTIKKMKNGEDANGNV